MSNCTECLDFYALMRLTHGFDAQLRAMEMSGASLFIFIEGVSVDPTFYSRVCDTALAGSGVTFEIVSSEMLTGTGGGKSVLLEFYDFLASRGKLTSNLEGKVTRVAFFVDKDVDDFRGVLRASPHIIYTRTYEVENEVFLNCDISVAASSAASVPLAWLGPTLSGGPEWTKSLCGGLETWVALCVLATIRGISDECNYGSPPNPRVVSADTGSILQRMSEATGVSVRTLSFEYDALAQRVRELFEQDRHNEVVRGKWFPALLEMRLAATLRGKHWVRRGFRDRLLGAALGTLDYEADWAKGYRGGLLALLGVS